MSRKILGVLSATLLALALGATSARASVPEWDLAPHAVAGPVSTNATINNCSEDNVCLYDWVNNNTSGGFWQRTFSYIQSSVIPNAPTGCVNLNTHLWNTGGSVYDTASSLILNRAAQGVGTKRVTFYNWTNCNLNGGFIVYGPVSLGDTVIEANLSNLTDCDAGDCSADWYSDLKISSIRVQPN